jgi:hypothetical protein
MTKQDQVRAIANALRVASNAGDGAEVAILVSLLVRLETKEPTSERSLN